MHRTRDKTRWCIVHVIGRGRVCERAHEAERPWSIFDESNQGLGFRDGFILFVVLDKIEKITK